MEAVWTWLQESGVWAVLVVWLALVWKTVKPLIWELVDNLIELIRQQQVRQVLVTMVRAAEQMFGAQSDAENEEAAKALGERKLVWVEQQAKAAYPMITRANVEAAVHEVKAGWSRTATASLTPYPLSETERGTATAGNNDRREWQR